MRATSTAARRSVAGPRKRTDLARRGCERCSRSKEKRASSVTSPSRGRRRSLYGNMQRSEVVLAGGGEAILSIARCKGIVSHPRGNADAKAEADSLGGCPRECIARCRSASERDRSCAERCKDRERVPSNAERARVERAISQEIEPARARGQRRPSSIARCSMSAEDFEREDLPTIPGCREDDGPERSPADLRS